MQPGNGCIIRSDRAHKYWCGLDTDQLASCSFYVKTMNGDCLYNNNPQGEYGDWCWNYEAAKDAHRNEK
jgi:hypothetical protein